MKRPFQVWLAFGACVALVAAAVGWLSLRALESERAEAAALRNAALEENVRLALWRMDSAMAPFVAQESARPYEAYQTGVLAAPLGRGAASDQPRGQPAPLSPLLQAPPQVFLYFQVGAEGLWSSPQVLAETDRERAIAAQVSPEQLDAWSRRFRRLIGQADVELLVTNAAPPGDLTIEPLLPASAWPAAPSDTLVEGVPLAAQAQQQRARSQNEFQARAQYIAQNTMVANYNNRGQLMPLDSTDRRAIRVGTMMPVASKGELFLVRHVTLGGQLHLQGCWLDWPGLRASLKSAIADLLPEASLAIVAAPAPEEQSRLMASLPVRLDPGAWPAAPLEIGSPVRLSLIATWGAMILAAAAVAVLLRGVVTLSERRADFVSAVTHELRTPLTTFRLYAEMLSEGMIADEPRRKTYLDTLRIEADRLSHLVENVLAYARLERGGLGNRLQRVSGEQLLSAATGRLAERAAQAQLDLSIDADDRARQAQVVADPSAVEQILFNLVDNACKYAARGPNRTLELEARAAADKFVLRIRDHGPGLPPELRRKLFQPFRKSDEAAAGSAPGVGLGLSLSRRLARDMHGDLRHDPAVTGGAALELSLPLVERVSPSRGDEGPGQGSQRAG